MFVKLDIFQFDISGKETQFLNIFDIFSAFERFQLEISNLDKFLFELSNIEENSITLEVSQFEISG